MHFTPRPRWLMMVSTAIVVLPVLRSPMMSSRWPRPTGVMASMALIPVWSGSCTGWRPVMPGAWTSIRRLSVVATGPLPSMGWPRALTTRPRRASPTGTERIRPVALTDWPSSISLTSPSTTAPIVSSSRLSASPRRPPSNSSSSLTDAPGRPDTRAMPSPTSTMVPTCAAWTSGVKSARRERSAAVMSEVSMEKVSVMEVPVLASEGLAQLLEPAPHRPVDDGVADAGDDATEDRRIDDDLDRDPLAGGPSEGVGEAGLLVGVEWIGGADLGDRLGAGFGRPGDK